MSSHSHRKHDEEQSSTAKGPGLESSHDPIARSETANEEHVDEATNAVGGGPGLGNAPESKQHHEQREHDHHRRNHSNHSSHSHRTPPSSPGHGSPTSHRKFIWHNKTNPNARQHSHDSHDNHSLAMHKVPTAHDSTDDHIMEQHEEGHKHGGLVSPTLFPHLSHPAKTHFTEELLHEHMRTLEEVREHLGLPAHAPLVTGHETHTYLTWSSIRLILREPFAEFFGTFIMILFGNGVVAQVLLSNSQISDPTTAPGGNGWGNYQSICWGWALGVMLGIYVAGDSGGFLNPAITLCFCLFRKMPWRRLPIYWLAQFLGGFLGSAVVYANYLPAINAVEGSSRKRTVPPLEGATAGIFATYPQGFLNTGSMFLSEALASCILMFVIFALKDDSNPGAMGKSGAGKLFPLMLFFLIFGIGASFGWETGYAINLARDFGPRLMSYCLGYGREVWSAGDYYFWVPMVAPFAGTLIGGLLYDVFIYTGPETIVNTPYWGLLEGWKWVVGRVTGRTRRKHRAEARESEETMLRELEEGRERSVEREKERERERVGKEVKEH